MRRIKIIKDHAQYKKGQVVYVSKSVASSLIESGYATMSKDMSNDDYEVK